MEPGGFRVVRNRTLLFALSLLATISVALSACDTAPAATTQLTDPKTLVVDVQDSPQRTLDNNRVRAFPCLSSCTSSRF